MKYNLDKKTSFIGILRDNGYYISTAESLTGGLLAAEIVSVPGASYAFTEGFVTYSIYAKEHTLGISKDILEAHGAVSGITAAEMAKGAALRADTFMALSTTGNAGPDASEGKPVGLVYTGIYINGKTSYKEYHFEGSREEIRRQTVKAAIDDGYEALTAFLRS